MGSRSSGARIAARVGGAAVAVALATSDAGAAAHVVVMREGARAVLTLGAPEGGTVLVPVPASFQKDAARAVPAALVERVARHGAPRLTESWEQDPCARDAGTSAAAAVEDGDRGVIVEGGPPSAEGDLVIARAEEDLRRARVTLGAAARARLRTHLRAGGKVVVARLPPDDPRWALRLHFDAPSIEVPLPTSPDGEVVVHVLAKGSRVEAAALPNVVVPTNLELAETAKLDFGGFYAALVDRVLSRTPGAVLTEHAADPRTCESCEPLGVAELVALGADVLPSVSSEPDLVDPQLLRAFGADAGVARALLPGPPALDGGRAPARRRYHGVRGFVLTRLRVRPGDAEVLALAPAPAISGGGDAAPGAPLERGARPSTVNAFRARYVVRHPWTGPVSCRDPRRGRFGASPSGLANGSARLAEEGVARAPLGSFLREDLPELDVRAAGAAPAGVGGPAISDAQPEPATRRGCNGCTSGGVAPSGVIAAAFLAIVRGLRARRARRDRTR